MRIAVDATELSGRPTGVGRYLALLLRRWVELPGDETFLLYVREDVAHELPDDPRLVLRRLPRGAALSAAYWQQVVLARELRRDPPDVLFAPADAMPLGLRGRTLLTVHDLAYFAHPEWFDFFQGTRRRMLTSRSVVSATSIVVPSRFTRDELVRRLGVSPDRVEVIHHGRDPRLDDVVPTAERDLRARLGQAGPFALMVGSIFERRFPAEVLEAFRLLADLDLGLVIAGADRRRHGGDLRAEIAARGLTGRVTWMDYCSEQDLVGLYRCAQVLIYLSAYEGFGLPPLEALGFGLPAIVSGAEALTEVYGEAVEVLPAVNAAALAERLRDVVRDPGRRAALIERGRRRARTLDAGTCAERTLSRLRAVAAGR